jgi:hypothetical protein
MVNKILDIPSKYNNTPHVEVKNKAYRVTSGWDNIVAELNSVVTELGKKKSWWLWRPTRE